MPVAHWPIGPILAWVPRTEQLEICVAALYATSHLSFSLTLFSVFEAIFSAIVLNKRFMPVYFLDCNA